MDEPAALLIDTTRDTNLYIAKNPESLIPGF
jgi:hypothetical protein